MALQRSAFLGHQGCEKDHQRKCDDVSELVSVARFKDTCRQLYSQFSCDQLDRATPAEDMGMGPQEFHTLEEACKWVADPILGQ